MWSMQYHISLTVVTDFENNVQTNEIVRLLEPQ